MPQPITSLTLTGQTPDTVETGQTGGWLLQAPAAFFRKLKGKPAQRIVEVSRIKPELLSNQLWLVTWQHRNGDVQTTAVMLSGVWHLADIESQARNALYQQHTITNPRILRLTRDLNMTPKRLDAVQSVTMRQRQQARFNEECG